MSAAEKIAAFPTQKLKGECELTGHEYPLVPPGEYEAVFSHYETNPRFSKKTDNVDVHTGGKVFCWFELDPYGNSGLPPGEKTMIFLPYNAKAIFKPFGRNGRFQMGKRSNCYKDYKQHIGPPGNSFSLNAFKGKLWNVVVKTVDRNEKQKKHSKEDRYSEIIQIQGLA